ncbi:MAG: ribosome small subunit-dependent GTPase A [Legionellaceae bacterium]|nr:ribosome small subunit-dependent GTPase A [Legionellaceae bacterium]
MSKRKISLQQRTRIQALQKKSLQAEEDGDISLLPGLVVARFGHNAEVEAEDGRRFLCSLRTHVEDLVAGDRVVWQLAAGKEQGVIVSVHPRTAALMRAQPRGAPKPVAANITQILIVIAVEPLVLWPVLDSYLVVAEHLNVTVGIVLNKTDLPCENIVKTLHKIYAPMGYSICMASQHQGKLGSLEESLSGQVSVMAGQSGVGKSSLISSVLPHEQLRIADSSIAEVHGRHTTTNSRWYWLPKGGALIDSPGVRSFDIWPMPVSDILYGFRDLRQYAANCKFRNCSHVENTPGCGIQQALQAGLCSRERYASFFRLCEEKGRR